MKCIGGKKLGVGIFRFGYVVCMVLGDVGAYGFRRGGVSGVGVFSRVHATL